MSNDFPEFIHAKLHGYNGQTWRTGEMLSNECEYVRRDLFDDVLDALKLLTVSVGTVNMADACDVARLTLQRHKR